MDARRHRVWLREPCQTAKDCSHVSAVSGPTWVNVFETEEVRLLLRSCTSETAGGGGLWSGLSLRPTDELVEFGFDERRDALAVLPECCVESLFGLIVEFVAATEDGVLGDLWMIDTDDAE